MLEPEPAQEPPESEPEPEEEDYAAAAERTYQEGVALFEQGPAWLSQHPEVEFLASSAVGWDMRRFRVRQNGSTLTCILHTSEFDGEKSWCWRDSQHIEEFSGGGFEETLLGYEGEVRLSPVEGQAESWRFRLLRAGGVQRALYRRHRAPRIGPPHPVWFASPEPTFSDPRSSRTVPFETMPTVQIEPETLGPLRGLNIVPVPNQTAEDGVAAIMLAGPDALQYGQNNTRQLCARVDSRWRCAEAQQVSQDVHSEPSAIGGL